MGIWRVGIEVVKVFTIVEGWGVGTRTFSNTNNLDLNQL